MWKLWISLSTQQRLTDRSTCGTKEAIWNIFLVFPRPCSNNLLLPLNSVEQPPFLLYRLCGSGILKVHSGSGLSLTPDVSLSWEDWTAGSHSAGWERGALGGFLTPAWCLSWHQLWLLNTHLLVACPRGLGLLTSSQPQTSYTGRKYRAKCSEDKAPARGLLWPSLKVTWHHFCRILLIKAATGSIPEMRWHGNPHPRSPNSQW